MAAITDLPPEMIAAKLKLEAISLLMIKCTVLLTAKIHIMVPWEISLNITDTFPSMLKMKKFRWTHEEIVTKHFSSFFVKNILSRDSKVQNHVTNRYRRGSFHWWSIIEYARRSRQSNFCKSW